MHAQKPAQELFPLTRALIVILMVTAGTRTASAGCNDAAALRRLARGVAGTFRCERDRLIGRSAGCSPPTPPSCAGTLVDDLVALGGTRTLPQERGPHGQIIPALRCQRAIVRGIARSTRARIRAAVRGVRDRRADDRARRMLLPIQRACAVRIRGTTGAGHFPNVGAPCADSLATVGARIDGRALVDCIEAAVGARLEPVLRRWLKPSMILILTDDQPASMVWPMATVQSEIVGDSAVDFRRGFVTTPLCCPSRASILTGRYAHNHRVLTNYPPFDLEAFDESSTIATWLHDAGYRTGLVGKYLNGYGNEPYVPPGWDDWHAYSGSTYFDYPLIENGVIRAYGSEEADYLTDVLAAKAVDFIRASGEQPFFLYFAPFAPHDPATPAPRHRDRYAGVSPWRPPSWNEPDASDKPRWFRDGFAPLTPEATAFADQLYQRMLESLLAVDEAVAAILQALRDAGRDDDTVVVFTSDNGFALGEHRWVGKICPWEECLRVPFAVRYPRLVRSARPDSRLVANIDLAPTFAEFGGTMPATPVDGASLAPLLDGSSSTWRTDLLAEQWTFFPPGYKAIRSERFEYIEYVRGLFLPAQVELYDLESDPYELSSVHADPRYTDVLNGLAARVREIDPRWTQPPPP